VKTILTPGAGCLIQYLAGENQGKTAIASAKQLGGTFKSCFEPRIVEILEANSAVPLAQYGKNFANEKAKTNTNPWADQIDTRGIWGDKLLAVNSLVQRRLGVKSFDEFRGNFLDSTTYLHEMRNPADGKPVLDGEGKPIAIERPFAVKMVEIIDSFLMNQVSAPLDLTLADGSKAVAPKFVFFPHSNHWIPYQSSSMLRKYFGLDSDEVPFAEAMLGTVLGKMEDTTPNAQTKMIRDYYGLRTGLGHLDDVKEYSTYDLGDTKVYADRTKNTFAINLLLQIKAVKTLDEVKEERLEKVLAAAKAREDSQSIEGMKKAKPVKMELVILEKGGMKDGKMVAPKMEFRKPPSGLSPEEEAAAELPSFVIQAYMNGVFDEAEYYELVLRMLVRANARAGLLR
jgi:hypothetical protein